MGYPLCAWKFQSTAPVWGRLQHGGDLGRAAGNFNPRPPCGGRPQFRQFAQNVTPISIHGPRVGADVAPAANAAGAFYFNPRPPCGGRLCPGDDARRSRPISIHGPRVGADAQKEAWSCVSKAISIHGPRVGADDAGHCAARRNRKISIHGPRVGADWAGWRFSHR